MFTRDGSRLILLSLILLVLAVQNQVVAWNILYKTAGIGTLVYYPNYVMSQNGTYTVKSGGPFFMQIGYTNQPIYVINIPFSLQTSVFYLKYYPFNSAGTPVYNGTNIYSFIPYGYNYTIPSQYFQLWGKYSISNSTNSSTAFLLYSPSAIPKQLYNATLLQPQIIIAGTANDSKSAPSNMTPYLNALAASLRGQAQEVKMLSASNENLSARQQLLNRNISILVGTVNSLSSTITDVEYLGLGIGILLVLILIITVRKYREDSERYALGRYYEGDTHGSSRLDSDTQSVPPDPDSADEDKGFGIKVKEDEGSGNT
jgi:hypothetical protein